MKAKGASHLYFRGRNLDRRSLEIAKSRIQIMIQQGGMDNAACKSLQGLVDRADARIAQIKSGEKPALAPDADAKYAVAEVVVDLDSINEPMTR